MREKREANIDKLGDELNAINTLLETISEKHNLSKNEVLELLREKKAEKVSVPVSIYKERKLGIMEATVKYLKEEGMSYHKIGEALLRDDRVIWVTYSKAVKKKKAKFKAKKEEIKIPVSVFTKGLGPLQSVVNFLREEGYSNNEVSKILERDNRTVWAVYSRIKNSDQNFRGGKR